VALTFTGHHHVLLHERPESADRVERRALAIWPRLNHRALHRCEGDPTRIAAQVAHRTKMTRRAIKALISDR
jgi:hypothetical protein